MFTIPEDAKTMASTFGYSPQEFKDFCLRTEAEVAELRKQKLLHTGRQIGKTEMTQQVFKQSKLNTMSVDNKLDAIIHLLTNQTRLDRIEEALTQITNQLNLLSTVTVASTRPAQLTDDPLLNAKLAEYAPTPSDEELALTLCNVWSNGSVYNNPWLRVAKKARELLQPSTSLKLTLCPGTAC